jgi:hypothetical protein
MKKRTLLMAASALLALGNLFAKDDVPRGYDPISDLEKARTEATTKNKLIMLVVKGRDDDCPYCVSALANGEKAVGSGVVKVFARAEALNTMETSTFPPALQERARRKFTTGASVTVLVFNPDMSKLLAQATRRQLESDRKAISAFQKEVSEHKRQLR